MAIRPGRHRKKLTAWLDAQSNPLGPGATSYDNQLAVRAWNMLGGLDWQGLPIVAEILGIEDIESLITRLIAIRDHQRAD